MLRTQRASASFRTMSDYQTLLRQGRRALVRGQRREARRLFEQALVLDPAREEAWLLIAAVASPHASLAYLARALEINPRSQAARNGIAWARRRLANEIAAMPAGDNVPKSLAVSPLQPAPARRPSPGIDARTTFALRGLSPLVLARDRLAGRAVGLWLMASGVMALTALVVLQGTGIVAPKQAAARVAAIGPAKATFTPTATYTPTNTPTFTPTNTPTSTPTNTPTATPTNTPTATATFTPLSTNTLVPPTWTPIPPTPVPLQPTQPPVVQPASGGERWIDVNLSSQTVTAYEGNSALVTFVVSTGTWRTPTVTGQYHIYVKYTAAPMSGPGYYLPGVPYVMYFYKGYGLHGTYWHNNFGTPMSHGCVNLTIPDSEWLFNFASVGTLVNIHY